MNPHRVLLHVEAYKKQIERDYELFNAKAYLQGQYFAESLMATVGNMFNKKGAKPFEYPKKPYEFENNAKVKEDELQKQRELFVAMLLTKQSNFELSKNNEKGE